MGRVLGVLIFIFVLAVYGLVTLGSIDKPGARAASKNETYRLVHAIGNSEKVVAKDLSKRECETQKRERKALVASLGTEGSVTCLPESVFRD